MTWVTIKENDFCDPFFFFIQTTSDYDLDFLSIINHSDSIKTMKLTNLVPVHSIPCYIPNPVLDLVGERSASWMKEVTFIHGHWSVRDYAITTKHSDSGMPLHRWCIARIFTNFKLKLHISQVLKILIVNIHIMTEPYLIFVYCSSYKLCSDDVFAAK